ncbi:Hypothetical protein RAK1035_0726 [Roseovarius sp. AK1035]|nr:Hypothetical protein RAK1035_0726 [Roseovarius sp. AK1035]
MAGFRVRITSAKDLTGMPRLGAGRGRDGEGRRDAVEQEQGAGADTIFAKL